jgi:hypothetical protein
LNGKQAVDLGASVSRSTGGAVLGARVADSQLDRATEADARWRRLRDFAHGWSDPDSPLATRIPFLFLELDTGGLGDGVPVPSVFLGLDWLLTELSERVEARAGLEAVLDAAGALRNESLDVATAQTARTCFDDLPTGGVLLHAGVMLSRAGESLRLSALVPRTHVAVYLPTIGRRDSLAALMSAIERYAGLGGFPHPGSHVQLDFDPASEDTRIGLTLRPDDYRMWPALLRLLVDDGLCEPARAEGLLRWSGVSIERELFNGAASPVMRTIEHIKVVCQSGRVLAAKAYFGATPRFPDAAEA